MAPFLEDLAEEIVENIVQMSNLDDICNLRQCSKILAAKSAHGYFKSFYRSKRVDLAVPTLQAFVEATRPSRFGCLVEELVLIGIIEMVDWQNLKTKESQMYKEIDLLGQAFSGLADNGEFKRLRSLSLEVAVITKDGDRVLPAEAAKDACMLAWNCAAYTFGVTRHALSASSLPIEKLNIFNNSKLQVCSLPWDQLADIKLVSTGLSTTLASVKSLSVSLSNTAVEDRHANENMWEEEDRTSSNEELSNLFDKVKDDDNSTVLTSFMQRCTNLTDFELHYFILVTGPPSYHELFHEQLLRHIFALNHFPELQSCRLRGVYARAQDLLVFIKRTHVRDLSMENVHLCWETFNSIFEYCVSDESNIERIYFDNLFEDYHTMIYFDAPGSPRYDFPGNLQGCNTLKRSGTEIKKPISYRQALAPIQFSPAFGEWKTQTALEYGPYDVRGAMDS